jgi:hypothetical protein
VYGSGKSFGVEDIKCGTSGCETVMYTIIISLREGRVNRDEFEIRMGVLE